MLRTFINSLGAVRRQPRAMRMVAAAATAWLIGTTAAQAAGLVFSDDFESGSASKWVQDDYHNMCKPVTASVDGVGAHGGKYSLECNWNGTVAWNDPAAYSSARLNSWSFSSEFLIRMWVRYATDVDHVSGNKLLRITNDATTIDFFLDAQMDKSGEPMFASWDVGPSGGAGLPSYWGDSNSLGDGTWHKLELYVKVGGAGAFKLWLDGSLKLQGASVNTSASWFPLYLMSNWSNNPGWQHDANNHVYWDDVQIYSDTGSGATGNLSDASIGGGSTSSGGSSGGTSTATAVPNPPANVSVQ